MGAAVIVPEAVGPAAAALLAGDDPAEIPAAAAVVAVTAVAPGPLGWLMAAVAATAGAVGAAVVAGDEESFDFGCWQDAIGSDAVASLGADKVAFHTKHGMLLSQVVEHCKILKAKDDGRLILKNKAGEHYGLSITLVLPAHESGLNPEQDVTLLHAVRVQTV